MTIGYAALVFTSVLSLSNQPQQSIDYRFDEVRRSVTVTTPSRQLAAQTGSIARSGDRVQTGWFSYALIASEQHRAKFEIFSSTEVQLAGGTPGVILSLERGRLHAMFDKITGSEPRLVKTPGALLAVRGTQYDVSVDNMGGSTLTVTEGVVEVRSALKSEPVFVRAGEMCSFSLHEPPVARPAMMRGPGDSDRRGRDGSDPHGRGSEGGERGEAGRGTGSGMMPPGGMPPNGPPPGHPHP